MFVSVIQLYANCTKAVVCLLPTILSQLLSISVALVKCNCAIRSSATLSVYYCEFITIFYILFGSCAFFSLLPRQAIVHKYESFLLHMLTLSPIQWAAAYNSVCNTFKIPYRITVVKCIAVSFALFPLKRLKYPYRGINCHVLCLLSDYSHLEYVKVFDVSSFFLSHTKIKTI